MPFMIGREPIRRTLNYLNAGKLVLKNEIQIFSVNYNAIGKHHEGARDFVFWHLPQIQYKNPNVQVITFKNMTPTPFVRCFYEDGKDMIIDIDSQSKDEIMMHLVKVVGKSWEVLQAESRAEEKTNNFANFGVGCSRSCMCVIPGQVPCPGVIPLPYHMRGKHRHSRSES
ncbi:mitochondrial ribosomal protein S25 [Xylocopa sonorina]|uniref:mitochondrial ribosomal protein S25 n=1 Tax=Xylocopa sonorina TaxID=1818115 RepID=UPI00403AD69F